MTRTKTQLCTGGKGWFEVDKVPKTKAQLRNEGEDWFEVNDMHRTKS